MYTVCFCGQVLRNYFRGTQGCPDLCFSGFSTYGEPHRPLSWMQPFLFARMWHWSIVRNIWRGSGTPLHEYVRVLLHLQQFLIRRQVRYPPYGRWEHVPAHVWVTPAQEDKDDEDVVGDDGDVCALCCTKSDPEKMSMCGNCQVVGCNIVLVALTRTHVTM